MKSISKKIPFVMGLFALGLLMPQQAKAQNDSVSMNLDKVLEVALSDNPDIKVADKTIEIQKYAKKETITGLFPTLSASASGVKNIKVATMVMAMGDQVIKAKMGRPYNYQLTGTVALPLVAPQLWKSVELCEEQVQLAIEQARSSKVSTISGVKKAFYSVLLTRDSYDAILASYNVAEESAQNTAKMFEQGLVSEYDKLTADVQLASIKPQLLQVANGLKLAEMQLKVLMGVDVEEPIKFEGKLSDYETDLFSELMLLKEDTSLDNNSTLKQLDIQRRQLELSEKLNKLGYIPTLALQLQAGYSSMPDKFNPFKADYYGSTSLALAFSWNIWDGGAKMMKTRQNKLQIENIDIQREHIKRQLELSISSSLNSIETAAEQVVSNKENVYSAEKAYNISKKRYDVGSGTMLELNSSETQLLNARLQYVQSIYDFLSNRASLEETLGKVVTAK